MGFFSGIANFGSKILGGVKKAALWVAPALQKVLSTISGPIGMIHHAIGGALGAGANLAVRQLITNDIAYYIQYQKRSNSSGGMMSNDEYQLFIDNNNALVYAANNQIIDGMASDYALKIEPNGLLTIKNLKPDSAGGDFAFSAESGTVWMYDSAWYNRGDIVPDQVTPASDATPLSDGTATAGISTEYSRGDHVHPLNITSTIPISDSASGSVGTTNYYARNDHSHPINVETNASNIPIVNGVGANGTSAFHARHDHIHPQQLTYVGNVTATKFIKTGGTVNDMLLANGDTKAISYIVGNYVDLATNQTIYGIKTSDSIKKTNEILSFNGSVIAGTGASNSGESSITYSQCKAVQCGINSSQSGGLYVSGQNLYWNARTVLFSSASP
ncbi:MAG: hypothetical protein EZS28_016795 [Streblomastix strix]|uniref:Uncharacterized protein n=1 Tax=Streblomastix strix TaxID=222440 RepID=A0A5J4VZK8_9EUKA|nr:MAG: hypothetical protein EZS28_016795 [Streblomastix strix]